MNDLTEEREELRAFHALDKERRAYEYTIYTREAKECSDAMHDLDEARQSEVAAYQRVQEEVNELDAALLDLQEQRATLEAQERELKEARDTLEGDIATYQRDCAALEASTESHHRTLPEAAHGVDAASAQSVLAEAEAAYAEATQEATAVQSAFDALSARRAQLLTKQGRSAKFATVEERNQSLEESVQAMRRDLADAQTRYDTDEASLGGMAAELANNEEEVSRLQEILKRLKEEQSELTQRVTSLNEEILDATEDRKYLFSLFKANTTWDSSEDRAAWREEHALLAKLTSLKEAKHKSDRLFMSTVERQMANGLDALVKFKELHPNLGYHGPLYTLFDFDPRYRLAIEQVAGNALFHVVVDTEDTAQQVLAFLQKEKVGRVTIMPLDRLHPKEVTLPTGDDVLSVLSRVKYAPEFEPAFRQVFGRAVMCPTLQACETYAKSHGVTAVTLDGDKVEKKGAMTGGFTEATKSRLFAIGESKKVEKQTRKVTKQLATVRETIADLDRKITDGHHQLGELDRHRSRCLADRQRTMELAQDKEQLVAHAKETMAQVRQQLTTLAQTMQRWEADIAEMAAEKERPLHATLSPDEEEQLETVLKEMSHLTPSLSAVQEKVAALSAEKVKWQRVLDHQSLASTRENGEEEEEARLAASRLASKQKSLAALQSQWQQKEEELEDVAHALTEWQRTMDQTATRRQTARRAFAEQQKWNEKYISRKAHFLQKKEEADKRIRDLGIVPSLASDPSIKELPLEEVFFNFSLFSISMMACSAKQKVIKALHDVNARLKQYSHVNKKAAEQFNQFYQQREELAKRKKELDASEAHISDLVAHLDQRKTEAMDRTFKHVSSHFTDMFHQLVPQGRGTLHMLQTMSGKRKKYDVEEEDEEMEDKENTSSKKTKTKAKGGKKEEEAFEKYDGVAIKV